jgi:hypothetical protein
MKSVVCKVARLVIAAIVMTLSAYSQSSPRGFDGFFAKFKPAVMSADTLQLQDLMAQDFDFMGTTSMSPSEVFKGLGSSGQWNNLQSAVQSKVLISQTYKGKPARFLRCTPLSADNMCYVVFQTDSLGKWRWRAMVMPQK